jgi:hypothetical protein
VDSEVVKLLSRVYAFCDEEQHVIMDFPFVPFHIKACIVRHVVGALMDQSQDEEQHVIMDFPFVPFHIKACIVRHVELQNVVGALMDQSQDEELGFFVIHNRLRGMDLGGQLGPQS